MNVSNTFHYGAFTLYESNPGGNAIGENAVALIKIMLTNPNNLKSIRDFVTSSQILSLIKAAKRRMGEDDWEIQYRNKRGKLVTLSNVNKTYQDKLDLIARGIRILFDKYDPSYIDNEVKTPGGPFLISSPKSRGSDQLIYQVLKTAKGDDSAETAESIESIDPHRIPMINLTLGALGVIPFKNKILIDNLKILGFSAKSAMEELK